MLRSETLSIIRPLLRDRLVQILLVVAPALTAVVAVLTTSESNPALTISLHLAAGVIISVALVIALSIVAREVADDRVSLAQATGEGLWRARANLLSIHDDESGLYTDWFLRLRIEEEMDRSKRYDQPFTVLRIRASGPHDAGQQVTKGWLSDQIQRELRKSDLAALLRDGSVGIMLPNTRRPGARRVQLRLSKALAPVGAQVGLACFPEDGKDAVGLLMAAQHALASEPSQAAAA